MRTIEDEVANVLTTLLSRPVLSHDNVTMKECEAWDSFKHIEIIMTMEQKFGISIALERIPALTSQAEIVAELKDMMSYD